MSNLVIADPSVPGKSQITSITATATQITGVGSIPPSAVTGVTTSTGAGDSGKIPKLNGSGLIDSTMLPAAVAAIPPGAMMDYGAATAPSGWLLCDGAAVSRATYADLFAIVSTTFGVGDGVSTFNVPDFRGRVGVGTGTGSGLTARTLAATGGEENHALSVAELAAHTHQVPSSGSGGGVGYNADSTELFGPSKVTSSTGSGTAHNTMQPFLVATKIIKT